MDINAADTATLSMWLDNARRTYRGAIGHGKSERNRLRVEAMEREFKRRGEIVPDDRGDGEFNGPGSC